MPESFINQAVEQFIQREFPNAPVKILFIGENYPGVDFSTYFYRTLLENVDTVCSNPFLHHLFSSIGIPTNNAKGTILTERDRLTTFLEMGYRMIDALPNHIKPKYPILDGRLNELILKIRLIAPEKIIFLGNRTESIIRSIEAHAEGEYVIERLISRPILNSKIRALPYPAPPANPHYFMRDWQRLIDLNQLPQ